MNEFEDYLATCLDELPASPVKDAMYYSLLAGGKRIRPNLLFCGLMAYGLDPKKGYAAAAAIEMIHTYSLIHDDLPAMDNDTLRRGKPTCHIAYGEATAILAGDALLTQAFVEATRASDDTNAVTHIVKALAEYSGAEGMVLGQSRDLEAQAQPAKSIEALKNIHLYKTGKLLTLPLLFACLLAGKRQDREAWKQIGQNIGLAFQIQDDIFDVTASVELLGKSSSDLANDKATYVKFMGIDAAQEEVSRLLNESRTMIKQLQLHDKPLLTLIDTIAKRES